jgi:hypothetical protein
MERDRKRMVEDGTDIRKAALREEHSRKCSLSRLSQFRAEIGPREGEKLRWIVDKCWLEVSEIVSFISDRRIFGQALTRYRRCENMCVDCEGVSELWDEG